MGELTTDSTPGGSTPAAAPTAASVAHDPSPRDRMHQVLRGASAQPGLVEGRDPRVRDWFGSATWEQRFGRWFQTLEAGDVLVSERALGQTSDEVARTIRTLRLHNLVVKMLSQGVPHLEDARG